MKYFNRKQKIKLARSLFSKTAPAYVQFYITSRCNLACEQCNIIYADSSAQEMNIEQIRRMAENLARIGVCIVLLIGGEPFVRKDLPEIVKAFTDVDIHVRMQTNGLASREMLEACIARGGHDISISLDSLRPCLQDSINGGFHKSWDRALLTISTVNELFPANGTAFFNSVLMRRNIEELQDVVRFAAAIGWGVSVVPVHMSQPESPRGFRTFDDSQVVAFPKDSWPSVREAINNLKELRRGGLALYDSEEYLEDIYRFVTGQPLQWRRRNHGVCDSPNLYFAISPNGNVKVCCDYEMESSYPVFHPDFPAWYWDGRIHREVYSYTQACGGCMYGSYPELTISARYLKPMLERFLLFNVKTPVLKKLSVGELRDIAADILYSRTGEVADPTIDPERFRSRERENPARIG